MALYHKRSTRIPKNFIKECNRQIGKNLDFIEGVVKTLPDKFDSNISCNNSIVMGSYLREHFFSKCYHEGVSNSDELRNAALEKLRASEAHCKFYNEHRPWRLDSVILDKARAIIRNVLGDFSYEYVLHDSRFSGGASHSMGRSQSTPSDKFASYNPDCTPLCFKFYEAYRASSVLSRYSGNPKLVRGNRVTTVPKNNRTDRAIAIEPTFNMFLQLGVGGYIRRRLKAKAYISHDSCQRIDLNDQSVNRSLAKVASLYRNFCTVDLSSASDNISWGLVYDLLPPDWFEYLDGIRSHYGDGFGRWEKFSSMGNGFTFELESLIFYAVVTAAQLVKSSTFFTSIYGDDIICPDSMYQHVTDTLRNYGFIVNNDKSFYGEDQPIRESCGGHYYNGVDITPFYIRRWPLGIKGLLKLLNDLRRFGSVDLNGRVMSDPRLYRPWLTIYRKFKFLRYFRSCNSDLGDTVLWVPYNVDPGWSLAFTKRSRKELPIIGSYLESLHDLYHENMSIGPRDPKDHMRPIKIETGIVKRAPKKGLFAVPVPAFPAEYESTK